MEGHKAPRERGNAGADGGGYDARTDGNRVGMQPERCEQMGAWRSFAASRCAYQDGGCAWMPNRRSHRSKPGISRLFSFDYRFDYNKKSKTAYGRPNGLHLPRMKDWGCAEIEQNGKRKIKNI